MDKTFFDNNCEGFNYTPTIIGRKRRVIAIGDIHGDYELARSCLKLAKCIDNHNNWIGGDTVVIQVGDQIDSCRPTNRYDKCNEADTTNNDKASDLKVLEFFTHLDGLARKNKPPGMVISLLGNHELMNVNGNMDYVSYENLVSFDPINKNAIKGELNRKTEFKPGGKIAKYLACTRLSSVIVGDFIFVHAGFVPNFIEKANIDVNNIDEARNDLENINLLVRKWLLGKIQDDLTDKEYVKGIVNSDPTSMFWDRILGTLPTNIKIQDSRCQNFLSSALNVFGVRSMVIGHTPQFHAHQTGINWTCENAEQPHGLYRVDFGGSHAFDLFDDHNHKGLRSPQVLEILYDKPGDLNDIPKVNILKN